MERDAAPLEEDAADRRPRLPFLARQPMRNEEHANGRDARGSDHPRLAPASRVGQFAQFRGPVGAGGALAERDHLARSLLVVEIKRGTQPDDKTRSANHNEVSRFHRYALAAHESQLRSAKPLRVVGLMIAQRYTPEADRMRQNLETVQRPRLAFTTWNSVLLETKRLHKDWLAVSDRRATET